MEEWVTALNDLEFTTPEVPRKERSLPFPGIYTVQLTGVAPSLTQTGSLRKEFGRPLFEIDSMTVLGPSPNFGRYKLWQRLPMTDVMEFGEKKNYLRDLVKAYDKDAPFATATEAFEIILDRVEQKKEINVRIGYYAEDFKGLKAKLEELGLNRAFSEFTPEERKQRNDLDRSAKVKGIKAFENEDGTYKTHWESPFGNLIPVRPYILKFYSSGYNPFEN